MFASTFLSAATALFFFAPSVVLGAPTVTRDLAVAGDKVAQVQSFVAETKTKITVIAAKLEATDLTASTVTEYVASLTQINILVADCKTKVDEVKYRTIGVHVGVDVPVAPVVDELHAVLELIAKLVAKVEGTVKGEVSVVVGELQITLKPVLLKLGGTVNGLLFAIEGVLGGVLPLLHGVVSSLVLTACGTIHITALIHI